MYSKYHKQENIVLLSHQCTNSSDNSTESYSKNSHHDGDTYFDFNLGKESKDKSTFKWMASFFSKRNPSSPDRKRRNSESVNITHIKNNINSVQDIERYNRKHRKSVVIPRDSYITQTDFDTLDKFWLQEFGKEKDAVYKGSDVDMFDDSSDEEDSKIQRN